MRPFFSDFVVEAKIRYPSLRPTLDKALDKIEEEPDLESLLSVLNGASDSVSGLPEELVTDEIRQWSTEAITLRSYLLSYIVERCETFDRQKAIEQCSPLFAGLATTGAIIFSTNYDRVIEHVCRSTSVELSDGFERTPDQAPSLWCRDFGGKLALAKLHGSVSWYEDSSGDRTYLRLDRGYPLPGPDFKLSRYGNDLSPLIIVPTLEKQVLKDPYAYLSNLFSDRLASTSLLVVMGSSLRDEHLASAIRFRADELVVIVIGKGAADAAARLGPNRTVAVEASSEDFLLNCTQDLLRLVEQATVGPLVNELEGVVEQFAGEQRRLLAEIGDLDEAERRNLGEMRSGEPLTVLRALSNLRGKANETIIDATLKLLGSSETDIRCSAAGNLGVVASNKAVVLLAQRTLQDTSQLVRIESALALNQIGTPEANSALADYRSQRQEDGLDQLL